MLTAVGAAAVGAGATTHAGIAGHTVSHHIELFAVVAVLSVHPTLHTLLLSRNPIGTDGLLALLEAVAPRGAGCPLQVLALANCDVSGFVVLFIHK